MRFPLFLFCCLAISNVHGQKGTYLDSLQVELKTADFERAAFINYEIVSILGRADIAGSWIYVKKADSLLEKHDTPLVRCFALMSHGSYESMTGAMDSSAMSYRRGAEQLQFIRDSAVHARVYGALGYAMIGAGRPKEAIDILIRGLYIAEHNSVKESVRAMIAANLVWAYIELKQYEECLRVARASLKWLDIKRNARPVVYLYNNMAASFGALRQSDSVYHYANKMIALAKEINLPDQVANGYFIIGHDLSERGQYNEALKYYLLAEPYRQKAQNPFFMVADLYTLSDLYYKLKDFRKGIATGEEAIRLARKHNITMKMESSYQVLAWNYEGLKDFTNASKYYRLLTALKDSLYNVASSEAVAEMQAKYDSEKKELALARKEIEIEQRDYQLAIAGGIVAVLLISGFFFYRKLVIESELKSQLAMAEAQNLVDQERLRISRELHDNIGSQLTFINHAMGEGSDPRFVEIKKMTLDTIRELRRTVWLINHSNIRLEEFIIKVREYLNSEGTIPVEVGADGDLDHELQSKVATNLFRVIQEAVNNAIKHSGASQITINVRRNNEKLSIVIADNGKGFQKNNNSDGLGLRNMEGRIRSIGGIFDLTSGAGEGTRISVSL